MGFWAALTGRRTPKAANLDALFAMPSAAVTLRTAAGLEPTGRGAVCFRAAAGPAFDRTLDDVVELLNADPEAPDVAQQIDGFGFTWLVVRRAPDDVAGLCTDLHAVNTALETQGFGSGLLCSLVPFAEGGGGPADGRAARPDRPVALVYLYKQGTFYPFAPTGPQRRDNLLEIQVRDHLAGELPMEPELSRWLALWGAPGL